MKEKRGELKEGKHQGRQQAGAIRRRGGGVAAKEPPWREVGLRVCVRAAKVIATGDKENRNRMEKLKGSKKKKTQQQEKRFNFSWRITSHVDAQVGR